MEMLGGDNETERVSEHGMAWGLEQDEDYEGDICMYVLLCVRTCVFYEELSVYSFDSVTVT